MLTKMLEDARKLRMNISGNEEATEYVCRAAVYLLQMEFLFIANALDCPECRTHMPYHSWQCDFKGALETVEGYLKK